MRIRLMAAAGLAGVALLATAGTAAADPTPVGVASNSPGVLSGNVIQIPSTSASTSAATPSTC